MKTWSEQHHSHVFRFSFFPLPWTLFQSAGAARAGWAEKNGVLQGDALLEIGNQTVSRRCFVAASIQLKRDTPLRWTPKLNRPNQGWKVALGKRAGFQLIAAHLVALGKR